VGGDAAAGGADAVIRRRPVPVVPEYLLGEKALGERDDAIEAFRQDENAKFTFNAYKNKSVRKALNAAFNFKCAYCEAYFGATQPVAVEHYRPKSAVLGADGKLKKPGYYWLAGTWTNLLPSCTDCNSAREQEIPGENPRTMGKANMFPIANEKARAKKPDQEKKEQRLLLHPYLDQPERHLVFDADGSVKPARTGGRESKKGAASIEVYALRRPQLATDRARVATLVRASVKQIGDLRVVFGRTGDPLLEQSIREEIATLKSFLAETSPYSAMARQLASELVDEIG
jgi:uncharacterized protein (TIGR02646 family)